MTAAEFKQQVLPYYKRLYSIAYGIMRDSDEAADVVQDAVARIWERREELGSPDSVEAFCTVVVRNLCVSRIRRRRETGLDSLERPPSVDTADRTDAADELRLVEGLIDRLPPSQQRVIRLSAMDGCSNEEIAEITGESAANVRQLLSRARRKLKELYSLYRV